MTASWISSWSSRPHPGNGEGRSIHRVGGLQPGDLVAEDWREHFMDWENVRRGIPLRPLSLVGLSLFLVLLHHPLSEDLAEFGRGSPHRPIIFSTEFL